MENVDAKEPSRVEMFLLTHKPKRMEIRQMMEQVELLYEHLYLLSLILFDKYIFFQIK